MKTGLGCLGIPASLGKVLQAPWPGLPINKKLLTEL